MTTGGFSLVSQNARRITDTLLWTSDIQPLKSLTVKRFLRSEAGATVLWVLSSLVVAAILVPWVYRAGTSLGEAAATRELPALLEWIGNSAARAKFGRFFSRSLLFSAVLLLPFLFRRLRQLRVRSHLSNDASRKTTWGSGLAQVVAGCLISGSLLWLLGTTLHHWGAYTLSPEEPGFEKILKAVLVPAIAAACLEEWVFRGLLLGLWLRFSKPLAACLGTSLVFAFVHFLEPPRGSVIADPANPLAGFELLGKILLHFTNPQFFVTDFATLFAIGMILAWTRLRTGALWFPIGLHIGWILAFKGCNLIYKNVPDHPVHPWGLGNSLRSGLFPMLTLAVTAAACYLVLGFFEKRRLPG